MEKYDIIIIGSGLGGLQCGYILSKKGYKVCVLEKNPQVGGCLQTFKRGQALFDTGFHYIGGLDEGQSLHRLFRYFHLLDLPWHKMDENGYDEVIINGKSYYFASGHEQFVETMASGFPGQRKNLENYARFLRKVGDDIYHVFDKKGDKQKSFYGSLFSKSAYSYLKETIDDPLLRNVLSGTALKMELHPAKLPLYTFAQINESYTQSAWRIKGGGSQITDSLAGSIRSMGSNVLVGTEVTRMVEKNGEIRAVKLSNGEQIEGNRFISDIHPALTLELLHAVKTIRPSYRNRISALENTCGMSTINIKLKENSVPYKNRNIHIHKDEDIWSYYNYIPSRKCPCVLVSYSVPEAGEHYARSIDLLTPMYWEEVEKWSDTKTGKRNEEYKMFKQQRAEECIDLASEYIPELKTGIDHIFTGTPLTYQNYTGTVHGSAYGIRKDCNNLIYTIISPKTPLSNLFLTGQNLTGHGILGVSMTSLLTCAEIIGMDAVLEDF